MTVVLADDWLTIHHGDARMVLAELEAESVQTVVTSPPYFGLRDYGLPPVVWGGDPDHAHEWVASARKVERSASVHWQHTEGGGTRADGSFRNRHANAGEDADDHREWASVTTGFCACGAWLGVLGLEPTPDQYVANIVEVMGGVRRVLRPDGTLWLNIGDSYAASATSSDAGGSFQADHRAYRAGRPPRSGRGGLKAKDRMMMPARVALALQADGWWLRDEIVWAKTNPMPSSVSDRTTPAHEMVYMLSKRGRYYYDADANREPAFWPEGPNSPESIASPYGQGFTRRATTRETAAMSSLSARGRRQRVGINARWDARTANGSAPVGRNKRSVWTVATQPYAEAHFATFPEKLIEPMILAGAPLGGVVLDPFAGSGTVGLVAQRLGRKAVLIDLSKEYLAQAIERIAAGRSAGEGPAIDMPVPFKDDGLWAEAVS